MDKTKRFFSFVFGHLRKNEHIRIMMIKGDFKKVAFFNSIDQVVQYVETNKHQWNIYFSLSTTDGQAGATENLLRRRVIAFDFDRKDFDEGFDHKDIIRIFKKIGLYYHAIIDTGNGYHVYLLCDDTTEHLNRLLEVNKALASRMGADMNAVVSTQILRVPGTYNFKNDIKKPVSWMDFNKQDHKPYDIENLYKKHCFSSKYIKYIKVDTMPTCVYNMLSGVEESNRNFALGRITAYLKKTNHSQSQALETVLEWNKLNKPPESDNKIKADFDSYWNGNYKLLGCVSEDPAIQSVLSHYCDKSKCKKDDKYEIIHTGEVLEIEFKLGEKMKKKRGKVQLNGNHIAIISILKIHKAGLNTKQLQQEITSTITRKPRMSRPTLNKVLNELTESGIISCIESKVKSKPNFYKLNNIKALENEKFNISYHAIQRYIDQAVGQNALRVYCYMLYRISIKQNAVQTNISNDLNMTQQSVSSAFRELEEARFLIIEKDYSINPLGVNRYRWLL